MASNTANSVTKRRLIEQLPVVNQTDTLKNFFAATIDHLFQPGQSEAISGYIGQKPVYYDSATDYYIAERTPARAEYQLEAAMISANSGGTITDTLTYDDLINYLRSQGAFVNNHSRLFEGDYYSWAPPVDIDKLNNYLQYIWLGSLSDAENEATVITLTAPRKSYSYDGNSSKTYPLPPTIVGIPVTVENPVVLINGVPVPSNIDNTGSAVINSAGLAVGDIIETIRYGDLTAVINGNKTFDFSQFMLWQSTTTNYTTRTTGIPNQYVVGQLVYAYDAYGVGNAYLCTADNTAAASFYEQQAQDWTLATNGQFATTGSRVRLVDGIGTTIATARYYIFDGVGTSIQLSNDYSSHPGGSTPQYVVIDRRSAENSPWTQRNLWVHQEALQWTGQTWGTRAATRSIIEFLPNLELYNYGTNRLDDVNAVLSNSTAQIQDNWDVYPFDTGVWDEGKVTVSHINGQFFGKLHDSDTQYVGSVLVDNGYVLQPGDRLFVKQATTTEPQLNNLIYEVISNPNVPLPSGATVDVVELILAGQVKRGDIVRVSGGSTSVFADHTEYWFNGVEWLPAQTGDSIPLFMLYDAEQNRLDDANVYPATSFTGSSLFAYQVGTGTVDPVLGFPLSYDAYGDPIFFIDPIVNRVTYTGGTVSGYYYHHFLDPSGATEGSFSNNWFPEATPSTQALINGVYDVPLNLQANPGNLEVSTISRSQWFDQFSAIMTSQVGFEGAPYSANNWRDTAKALGDGDKILQHRSPLLKVMLIAADTNYDLPAALRYADQEYTRFRNKFIQAIINLRTNGGLTDSDLPPVWVTAALNQMRLNKTSDFPFAGSQMAGGQYFIPPTPASLGLNLVSQPGLVVDTTYVNPVSMIRGHDGTMVPAFGDWRDAIMVALEQQIYDNIPAQFKTEARPVFDIDHYNAGYFYTDPNGLSFARTEVDAMLAPFFQRWVQLNKFDYRTNSSYDQNNPFSWNYSTCFDTQNKPINNGYWRGIYKTYFDTDRPHIAPWEMLGFVDQPVWWQGQYGPAPYTRGNTKLWTDLSNGYIAGGVRQGVDPRYVRTGLLQYIPVNDEGFLLDPISCGIIANAPSYQNASAPWQAGDYGPIESLWRTSPSFRFAQAQVSFLMKPARFIEQGWDTVEQIQDITGEWIYVPTGNRPQNDELYVHGELNADGSEVIHVGVQQWISDYMVSTGQSPSLFGSAIRGLEVRLAHKMAGFTTADNMRVLADNFGLVPAEDITISLYNSPSTSESVYSGVLIEWMGQGWRVLGYDVRNPFFSVIPGFSTGPKGVISLATAREPVINAWRPNVYYPAGVNVGYSNTVYTCIKGHTSGATFEATFWQPAGAIPQQAPRVTTYLTADNTVVNTVPYGTIFTTYQQVADFLLGYGRYLTQQGWEFSAVNPSTQEALDWNLMVKDFLNWAQVNWQPGNFITLSPGAQGVTYNATQGMVSNILDPVNGSYSMLDRSGMPIDRRNIVVNRVDGSATMLSKNSDVFACRVSITETEHILIFDNKTIFNDLIYDPLFNLRQPRLLLIGRRSTDWTGRLDAPGYMLINNQIKSNFTKGADDLLTMFDIEQADNSVLTAHARHDIGYDSRDYLSTLVLSDVEQFEFYQGLIHQKGAPGAFDKLLRSTYIEESSSTLNFFEEWAIKIDEYGAVNEKNARLAFLFGQSSITQDPQYIEFRQTNAVANIVSFPSSPNWIELVDDAVTGLDVKWVERPPNPLQAFPQRPTLEPRQGDYPVAGYVRLNEIDFTVFNASDIPSIYSANVVTFPTGSVTWAHNNDVFRTIGNSTVNTTWYLLGTETAPGYWDGSIVETPAQSNVVTDAFGNSYYQTSPLEAPFVTNEAYFTPTPGQTYTVTFTVRKTVADTNGIPSYVRPAFDAFRSDGTLDGALGNKSGFGYNPANDLVDTSNWEIGTWYQVESTWTCPPTPYYATARGRIRMNRTYPSDGAGTGFSNAVYQIQDAVVAVAQPVDWDALKSYNMSADGSVNTVANVVTTAEDMSVSNTTVRIFMVNPHGLTSADTGLFCVIDGSTLSEADASGVSIIANVGPNYFDLTLPGTHGFDFTNNDEVGPEVRVLRSIHFPNIDSFNASQTRIGIQDGDLAYVDGSPGVPWQVFQCNSITEVTDDYDQTDGITQPITYTFWNIVRSQPRRMDASRIAGSLIYDLQTKITPTDLQPQPLSLDHLTTVSPQTGIVPGIAMDEIDYALEYDPAVYNVLSQNESQGYVSYLSTGNSTSIWGPAQVGRVWWNLSTVRFLETETDNVGFGMSDTNRYNTEVQYRINNWGDAAPNTSVDVYEWVRSSLDPYAYANAVAADTTGTYTGTVFNPIAPDWVESEEYVADVPTTFYYFWVKNVTVVPNVPFRKRDVNTVAQFITNPMIEDAPWIAPIMPNGILVGGADPYVDDPFNVSNGVATSGTVLQVELENQFDDGVTHDEWILMRPQDERSLPPNWLWRKLRDSLVGFDTNKVNFTANIGEPIALPPVNKPPVWYSGPPPAPPFNT